MKNTWITEASVIAAFVGTMLLAGANAAYDPASGLGNQQLAFWLNFLGVVLTAGGGSGLAYRGSKKLTEIRDAQKKQG
jgi:hypothetical protein